MMNIEIRRVEEENLKDVMALRVGELQKSYIETPEECLKEAEDEKWYEPAALYVNNILVGFAMYGVYYGEEVGGRIWLDRYLIDERYQGNGFGSQLLEALIDHLAKRYEQKAIYLSVYENNKVAINLYKKFGFKFNGEYDTKGEMVMVKEL